MIDVDDMEYCPRCGTILAVIETAFDYGQRKATTMTRRLANDPGIPGYLVFYTPTDDGADIASFRVSKIAPFWSDLGILTAAAYCQLLQSLRDLHHCTGTLFAAIQAEIGKRGLQ